MSATDLLLHQGHVDGEWVDADSGATFPVINPATQETVAEVPRMGAAETRRAIEAAQRALPGWRTLFIAASTSVYRVQTKVASARLSYHR